MHVAIFDVGLRSLVGMMRMKLQQMLYYE